MTTAQALRGDGVPELQRIVLAVEAVEKRTPYRLSELEQAFEDALEVELRKMDGNNETATPELDRRKLRLELLRRLN